MRALNNLVSTLVELGDLERGFALMDRSLEAARRHGHVVAMAWVETQQLDRLYWIGEWEELLSRAERMLDESSSTTPTLMAIDAYIFRARVRLAKGNVAGALEDSARLLEFARAQGDPQVAFPALATRAQVLHEAGQHAEATAAVDELLSRWRESPTSAAGPWLAEVAQVLEGLGRGPHLAQASSRVRLRTRWLSCRPSSRGRRCRSGRRALRQNRSARRRGDDTPSRRRAAGRRGRRAKPRASSSSRWTSSAGRAPNRYVGAAEELLAAS